MRRAPGQAPTEHRGEEGSPTKPADASTEARRRRLPVSAEWLAHAGLAATLALVLVAVAQPIQTEDAWWHLALGRAYAGEGPWLSRDPLLHTASAAPAPAAWLSDVLLYAAGRALGFQGLRLVHTGLVAAILWLAWSLLRRASGSRTLASLGTAAFASLAAYRLYQLRPELLTILASLALYRLVLEGPAPIAGRRIAAAVLLLALWANAHAGFLLGPILLAAGAAGCLLAAVVGAGDARARASARGRRIAATLGLGFAATLANPAGIGPHLAYFRAGQESPDLERVIDEWARVDLGSLPVSNLPPSPLSWGLLWAFVVLVPPVAIHGVWRWRRPAAARGGALDPALVGVAAVSLLAPLTAVRFLWLGLFDLMLLAQALGLWSHARSRVRRAATPIAAVAAVLLAPAFVRLGDWRMIASAIPDSIAGYAEPYRAAKYHASAVTVLADAGLEGNLFNDYFIGGYLGYWLAPRMLAFVNGSMNAPQEVFADGAALQDRRGRGRQGGFLELLDRHRVDVFLGVRLPQEGKPNRPVIYTTGHLEGAPGWIPVFRGLREAVYLRANERNRANLERVSEYYAREGVPFDAKSGFDPAAVIRAAPGWAAEHGLIPADFAAALADTEGPDPTRRRAALDRLASLYAALGLYEQAIAVDRRILRSNPHAAAPTRRLVWSLLRLGRWKEAREQAGALAGDDLSAAIAEAARRATALEGREDGAALLARVPVFTREEASQLVLGVDDGATRPWRR